MEHGDVVESRGDLARLSVGSVAICYVCEEDHHLRQRVGIPHGAVDRELVPAVLGGFRSPRVVEPESVQQSSQARRRVEGGFVRPFGPVRSARKLLDDIERRVAQRRPRRPASAVAARKSHVRVIMISSVVSAVTIAWNAVSTSMGGWPGSARPAQEHGRSHRRRSGSRAGRRSRGFRAGPGRRLRRLRRSSSRAWLIKKRSPAANTLSIARGYGPGPAPVLTKTAILAGPTMTPRDFRTVSQGGRWSRPSPFAGQRRHYVRVLVPWDLAVAVRDPSPLWGRAA